MTEIRPGRRLLRGQGLLGFRIHCLHFLSLVSDLLYEFELIPPRLRFFYRAKRLFLAQ